MKQVFLLAWLLIVNNFVVQAQTKNPWQLPFPVDTATHEVSYQGVIKVPNTSAASLYARAKAWHARVVEPATRLPLNDDAAAGLFIGKRIVMVSDKRFVYTVAVECRDGQYEYLFTQFLLINEGKSGPTGRPGWVFVPVPSITPLLDVAVLPANITATGEPRPAIKKMLANANTAFLEVVNSLQQAMN